MAKFCTNCGKELEENAAMCVNCGKLVDNGNKKDDKKKKKGLPTWAIVLIVVGSVILLPLILIIVISIVGYNIFSDMDTKDHIDNNKILAGTIGDTLKSDDFKITLTDAIMYSSIEGSYYTDMPADGKEYLVFFFNIENISDESEYISTYNFDGYVDDNAVSVKYLMNDINGIESLGLDLSPGKKASGYVAFEIDTTWKDFEIQFSDSSWDDEDTLIFSVINEDSTQSQGA